MHFLRGVFEASPKEDIKYLANNFMVMNYEAADDEVDDYWSAECARLQVNVDKSKLAHYGWEFNFHRLALREWPEDFAFLGKHRAAYFRLGLVGLYFLNDDLVPDEAIALLDHSEVAFGILYGEKPKTIENDAVPSGAKAAETVCNSLLNRKPMTRDYLEAFGEKMHLVLASRLGQTLAEEWPAGSAELQQFISGEHPTGCNFGDFLMTVSSLCLFDLIEREWSEFEDFAEVVMRPEFDRPVGRRKFVRMRCGATPGREFNLTLKEDRDVPGVWFMNETFEIPKGGDALSQHVHEASGPTEDITGSLNLRYYHGCPFCERYGWCFHTGCGGFFCPGEDGNTHKCPWCGEVVEFHEDSNVEGATNRGANPVADRAGGVGLENEIKGFLKKD